MTTLPSPTPRGHLLLADDELPLLRSCARALSAAGYQVATAADGREAVQLLDQHTFDAIVSDISMPGLNGLELLRVIRQRELDVPVVLMTGGPTLETAVQALEFGALRYLVKPLLSSELVRVVEQAVRLHHMGELKKQALELLRAEGREIADPTDLQARFDRALQQLWMAYQPIVDWSARKVFGYEALLRSNDEHLSGPAALVGAAEQLGKLHTLGRRIRDAVAHIVGRLDPGAALFVNLHARDLADEQLYDPSAPLSRVATRVVLELTERAPLEGSVQGLRERVASLRRLGYRIAVDDLGAGYAGLSSFAQLEPEVVKLDMSLVRDVDRSSTKHKVVHSMAALCREMGIRVVAEGVETAAERDAVVECGCELLQGYFFGRPDRDPRKVNL